MERELHFQHFKRTFFRSWGNEEKREAIKRATGKRMDFEAAWTNTVLNYSFQASRDVYIIESSFSREMIEGTWAVVRLGKSRGLSSDLEEKLITASAEVVREAYFPMNFEKESRHVIKPSEGLCYRLMQATANMPLSAHGIPFPAIFIVIPTECGLYGVDQDTGSKAFDLEGLYLNYKPTTPIERSLEKTLEGQAVFTSPYLGGQYDPQKHPFFYEFGIAMRYKKLPADANEMDRYVMKYFRFGVFENDERTPEDILDFDSRKLPEVPGAIGEVARKHKFVVEYVFRLAFNLLIYMSSPLDCKPRMVRSQVFIDAERRKNDPIKLRKLIKLMIQDSEATQTTLVGQDILVDKSEKEHTGIELNAGARKMPTHWRRAHWRGVWTGVGDDRRLIPHFIQRVLVNKDRTGVPVTTTHTVV